MSNETSSAAHGHGITPEPRDQRETSSPGRSTLSGQDYDPADSAASKETTQRSPTYH
jgi:MFS transporter, MHS family, proline/betaine transporter